MMYGSARPSTEHGNLAAQIEQLEATGRAKVFREQASGAPRDCARLRACLEPVDVLMVTRVRV